VRQALDQSGLGNAVNPARLDGAVIRLSGRAGRPITQAVSSAVYEVYPEAHGLAYISRIDDKEQCWALYDHTPVSFTEHPLDAADPSYRGAVQSVANPTGSHRPMTNCYRTVRIIEAQGLLQLPALRNTAEMSE
jgi:hypothetical protein